MLSKAGFPFVEVLAAIHPKPRGEDLRGLALRSRVRVAYDLYGSQIYFLESQALIMWCESHRYSLYNVSGMLYN